MARSVKIHEETYIHLSKIAKQEGRTITEIINRSVRAYIEERLKVLDGKG